MKAKLPYLILVAVCVAVDLWTKAIAFDAYDANGRNIQVIATDAFELDWGKVLNHGGMFGMGADNGGILKYLRLGALAIVLFFFLRAAATMRLFLVALSLILAGALGNLYDSFFNNGAVRDFIEVRLLFMPKSIFGTLFDPWPTFNVADSLILIGAGLLVIQLFFDGKRDTADAKAPVPDERIGTEA